MQRIAGHAADAPIGHHRRAHLLVEADRVVVPVEHAPFEAAVVALDRKRAEPQQQRLADAAPRGAPAATYRSSRYSPGLPRKVEKLVKYSAKATTCRSTSATIASTTGFAPNRCGCSDSGVTLQQVRQLFELGKLADQADDRRARRAVRRREVRSRGASACDSMRARECACDCFHRAILHRRLSRTGQRVSGAALQCRDERSRLSAATREPQPVRAGARPALSPARLGRREPRERAAAAARDAARLDGRRRVVPVRRRRDGSTTAMCSRSTGAASA